MQSWTLSRCRHLYEISSRRCRRTPVYGRDLINAVTTISRHFPRRHWYVWMEQSVISPEQKLVVNNYVGLTCQKDKALAMLLGDPLPLNVCTPINRIDYKKQYGVNSKGSSIWLWSTWLLSGCGLHGYSLAVVYMLLSGCGLHGYSLAVVYMATLWLWSTWLLSGCGLHGYSLAVVYMATLWL